MEVKTEKEKMLTGQLYFPEDLELTVERNAAHELAEEFNASKEHEIEKRQMLLGKLLGSRGENSEILVPFYCDYGYNIHIGAGAYLNFGVVILDCNKVHIGDNVFIGPYVQIYTAYHPVDPLIRQSRQEYASAITIQDNVWIGGGAIICPGVTIGVNTTIGAGSVVVADIPPGVVAAGNPCRVLKKCGPDIA